MADLLVLICDVFFLFFKSRRCHFPIGILGQVWCLIVSIPDLYPLSNLLKNVMCSFISLFQCIYKLV